MGRRSERLGVDTTEVTRVRWGVIREVPKQLWTASAAPSGRAQAVLVFTAFLLGAVVSALAFVGIWRHTAAASDRAQVAQTISQHRLADANRHLQGVRLRLEGERALVARVRKQRAALTDELTRLRRTVAGLPGPLESIGTDAAALSRSTSRLASELSALQSYVERSNNTGIDAGFVAAQIGYLISSTRAASANATALDRRAQAAAAVAGPLNTGK